MSVTNLTRNSKLTAARAIAKTLGPAENAIDTSIVENAQLIIAIVKGRMDAGLAPEAGHDAYLSAAAGMIALRDARDHAITCHRQLADVRDALRMSAEDVGCTVTKVEPGVAASLRADAA